MLAMEHMGKDKAGGRGGILVNVAEHRDVRCTAQLPVYSATKQAIVGLSQSLAVSVFVLLFLWTVHVCVCVLLYQKVLLINLLGTLKVKLSSIYVTRDE